MDPKKTALIARAFRDAKVDVQEVPETLATIAVAYASELQKANARDGDTLVFMTIDHLMTQWQPRRGEDESSPVAFCRTCLENLKYEPADFWVIAKGEKSEERIACCDAHAAQLRNDFTSAGVDVKLERIRR